MKILHCTAQLPTRTGSGVYFSTLLEGLTKLGHQNAALYGTQEPYTNELFSNALLQAIKTYPVAFLTQALPFPIVGMSDSMPYKSTRYSQMTHDMFAAWFSAFERMLRKAREAFRPDAVIVHHAFILASVVQKIFPDTNIMCICHGTDIRQIRQHPEIKKTYISNLDRIKIYATVSPKSNADLQEIFAIPEKNIHLLGGGFNPCVFNIKNRRSHNKKHRHAYKILYAGKIAASKGVFELAKAFPALVAQYPNVQLSIVGNTTAEQLRVLKSYTQNSTAVKFYNALDQKALAGLFKSYDLFVMPSYYETLGLIAIEALACGIRVVASEIEGLQSLLGDTVNASGIIEYVTLPRLYDVDKAVEEDKPAFVKMLSDKILLQLSRIANGETVAEHVLRSIQSHSWQSIIEKVNTLLEHSSL